MGRLDGMGEREHSLTSDTAKMEKRENEGKWRIKGSEAALEQGRVWQRDTDPSSRAALCSFQLCRVCVCVCVCTEWMQAMRTQFRRQLLVCEAAKHFFFCVSECLFFFSHCVSPLLFFLRFFPRAYVCVLTQTEDVLVDFQHDLGQLQQCSPDNWCQRIVLQRGQVRPVALRVCCQPPPQICCRMIFHWHSSPTTPLFFL